MKEVNLDVLVIGGGIAGLWLLDELHRAGSAALLVESTALGNGQTVPSQGILHSGFKHAIGGRERAYVRALNGMTEIWRACLAGTRQPNLSSAAIRGGCLYCWRTGSLTARFTQTGARLGLRVNLTRVPPAGLPIPLRECPGDVYRLEEQVIDTASLVSVLARRNEWHIVHVGRIDIRASGPGSVDAVDVVSADDTNIVRLRPNALVLSAGEGNAQLREACGLKSDAMKRLPLSILVIRGRLPVLNGFCIDGIRAKAVITTQTVSSEETVWQVASENVSSEDPDFQEATWREVYDALPGFEWPKITLSSYRANRAECVEDGSSRSDGVQVLADGNVVTAWPTKLVLAPLLASEVLKRLPPPSAQTDIALAFAAWPRPLVAAAPWEQ